MQQISPIPVQTLATLSAEKVRAIHLLVAGHTIPETANQVGVRRETIWRWTKTPAFAEAVAAGRMEILEQVGQRLVYASCYAVDVLCELMKDRNASAGDRLKAAVAVLDRAGVSASSLAEELKKANHWDPFGD